MNSENEVSATTTFSARQFLRSNEALLVHFNTPMSRRPLVFPADLQTAMKLTGVPLCFSTVQVGDQGPWQGGLPHLAQAQGSVGLVVDLQDAGLLSVYPDDAGSYVDSMGQEHLLGAAPTAVTCAESIAKRGTLGGYGSNEWFAKGFTPIGIFFFEPGQVFDKKVAAERWTDLPEILAAFPNDRIFSTRAGQFVEYDRQNQHWAPIAYSGIVP